MTIITEELFIKILNMSITATWFILAVIILRFIFKKIPKGVICILWGLVALRLILPFSFESVFSLIPSNEMVPEEIIYAQNPAINSGISFINSAVNPIISESFSPEPYDSVNPLQTITFIAVNIWIFGIIVMLLYTLISYMKLYFKTRESIIYQNNIRICDRIDTPFILGIIKPRIYLPSDMDKENYEYVISHEKAHLKRKDHLWKPLGFVLLTIHWFNPLIWTGYILLCRDIESACDQKVIKGKETEYRKKYSLALLNSSVSKKYISACPLAFGETGIKSRIKTVLNYKKPAFIIIILFIILSIVLSFCFLSNPKYISINEIDEPFINSATFYDGIEKILITKGENSYSITDSKDIEKIVSSLKKIEIKKNPISLSRGEERDKTNRINIGKNTLCFNKTYSEVWVFTGLKPKFSYKIKNTHDVKEIFENIDYEAVTSSLIITDIRSDIEGISISVEDFEIGGEMPYFNIRYTNDTDEEYTFGEDFDILYLSNDEFVSCIKEEVCFHAIGYMLGPHSSTTHSYYISSFDLSNSGAYRFRIPDSEKPHFWIDFTISNTTRLSAPCNLYGYRNSPDFSMPTLSLIPETKEFSFGFSAFSSYIPRGKYKLTDDKLILETNDTFKNKYVFDINGENYIFNQSESTQIPKYKYRATGEAISPVPHGAVFELFAPNVTYGPIIDGIKTDIDSDGKEEHCALFYGNTMGISSFDFKIWEKDVLEYSGSFNLNGSNMHFINDNNKIKIAYITYENKDSFIDVELKDDKIILLANGEKINNINK